jgi:hypothetical protein
VLREVALADLGPDTGGRGVGVAELGMIPLERLKLAEELVVIGVAERWLVEYVVLVRRPLQAAAQLQDSFGDALRRARQSASASPPSRPSSASPPCSRKFSTKKRPGSPARFTMRRRVSIEETSSRCSFTNHSSAFFER